MGHGVFPYGGVALPRVSQIVNRQSIALVYTLSGTRHIIYRHNGPKFPRAVSDKDLSHKDLVLTAQQKDTGILAADIDISHIDLKLALSVSDLQLRETHIFSLNSAFISIYVRNQSPIISHMITPLLNILCSYPLKV
jgi:hypothetical protein